MADTPILTQAQSALERLIGSPTVNVSTGGRTATDAVSATSDLQGKSHQAYTKRLADEAAAKKALAAAQAQTAAINAQTSAPAAAAAAAAPPAPAAQRFLSRSDLGTLGYNDFMQGYQGAMSRYQDAMGKKDLNAANQYAEEANRFSNLMNFQGGTGGAAQLDYDTYAPLIKQYTALPRA